MGTPLKFEFDFDEAKESAINQIKSEVKGKLALITLAVKNRFFISSFIKYDILSTWKKLI